MTMYRPRFCYANYVTSSAITVSSNSGVKDRLIDRNEERRWVAIGEGQAATITIALTKEIDTICLQNTNASVFTIKYNTSSNFNPALSNAVVSGQTINIIDSSNNYLIDNNNNYIVSSGIASNVWNSFYFKFTPVTPTTNVVITVTATTNSSAVQIGQVVVSKQIHEITAGGTMAVNPTVRQFEKEMSDGTTNKIYVRTLKGYDINLLNATPQERANLLLLAEINRRDAVYYIHRPSMYTDPWDGLGTHVNWINPTEFDNYLNDISGNGYTGTIQLRQAGGVS